MTLWLDDGDVRIYVGDVRDQLANLPDGSVDCVITSPPYWGLRDYGTGSWDGGDPDCDHQPPPKEARKFTNGRGEGVSDDYAGSNLTSWTHRDATVKSAECPRGCGAQRVDQQLGLEPTPDAYVQNMVEVFREVRRVLADHGTCFLNIADSYNSNPSGGLTGSTLAKGGKQTTASRAAHAARLGAGVSGTSYTAPRDSSAPGSACLDLCGECAADLESRTPHSGRPPHGSPSPVEPTDRDTERQGSARAASAAALLDAPASTTPESSTPPPAMCWRCGTQPASVSLRAQPTSSPDEPASAHTSAYTDGTSPTSPSSADRTTDTEPSALAYLYSSIASRRLKPKDAVLIPQLLALALQMDGWIVRSEIIWGKSNPMPESVTDRPTKSHEQVWMLSKLPRYWFDAEAVREPHAEVSIARGGRARLTPYHAPGQTAQRRTGDADGLNPGGRNVRSVWSIATQPYADAHFATYPEALVRRCLLAGCPVRVCRQCGRPSERIVEVVPESPDLRSHGTHPGSKHIQGTASRLNSGTAAQYHANRRKLNTVGWSDCGHNDYRPGVVLDPFLGSGTTAKVARDHGRHAVGIELNETYARLAADRLKQLSLLSDGAA